jgi:ABC-type multidrug transport system fused ATPase/permease subunit
MRTGSINKFVEHYKLQVKIEWKTIRNCFILLSRREIVRLRYVAVAQLLLAALDFLGVLLIGFIGTLSVYGIQSRPPNKQTIFILDLLGLEPLSFQNQVAILGLISGVVLLAKTLVSAMISRRTIFFLANRAASISNRIIEKLVFSNMEQIKRRSRFENMFALTSGVSSITVGVIGTTMNLFADFILILIMFSGLLLIEPTVAISIVFMFGLIAWLLYKLINKRVIYLASEGARFEILGDELLYELLGSYRELFASGLRNIYVQRISLMKRKQASVTANSSFIPLISKYVLEIAFVLGAILFTGIQFIYKDAVGAITIFMASAGRIVPAILRIQNAALTFRGATSSASRTLKIIEELNNLDPAIDRGNSQGLNQGAILASVNLKNVSFTYADGEDSVIKELSLDIEPGEWVAVVGPSGSGKTTLIDLILGILKPTHGQVSISNVDPELALSFWPGSVTYVPQDSFINNGTIEQNVALGKEITDIDRDRVTECLSLVGLSDLVSKSSKGLKSEVGELGSKLSGGQRQRLGVARALYPKPKLLILDEATSSLDNLSERLIIDCLNSLRGEVTVISIAHRLSTVVNSDRVIYIEQGRILASGSFNEVRHKVPNFDLQVKLSNAEEKK